MAIPTVKLVADVPVEIKEKIKRVARRKGMSVKELLVQFIVELPESRRKRKPARYVEEDLPWEWEEGE